MKKYILTLLFCLLCSPLWAGVVELLDEGVSKGFVWKVDAVGAGVVATRTGGVGTLTVAGGGGAEATTVSDTASINLTLTGVDITGDVLEAGVEAMIDLQDCQGAVTDAQVPNNITITEADPTVDTANEIEAILTNDAIDFGTGTVTTDGLTVQGNADIEGYAAIGNGSALNAGYTLIIDRDFTSSNNSNATQLSIRGIITKDMFAPDNSISFLEIRPEGVTVSAVAPPITTSLFVAEPNITEAAGGTALIASTVYIKDAPTEGTSNYALKVEDGAVEFDSTLSVGGAITEGGVGVVNLQEIDTFAELDTIVADKALVNKADGAVWLGVHDFGGVTSVEMPNGVDPDLTVEGQISWDTDDDSLRGHDGTRQIVIGQATKFIDFTVTNPDLLTETAFVPIWTNKSGFIFNITAVYSRSDVDDAVYTLKYTTNDDTDHTNLTTIEAITISTNGTGVYYNDLTAGIDDTTIETGKTIGFDAGATDCDFIHGVIVGYLDSDIACLPESK